MLLALHIDQAHSTCYLVQATSAKFELHVGSMKVSIQNKEWLSLNIIIQIILHMHFSIQHVQ
jgi:hypothetical protein